MLPLHLSQTHTGMFVLSLLPLTALLCEQQPQVGGAAWA